MKLTKAQRAVLHAMFGGRCAYCGDLLGERWHADHVEPCLRKLTHVKGKGLVPTGEYHKPQSNRLDNFKPACAPCNIDKHSMSLESWREKLARTLEVLRRNNPTYRHALRFGMLDEKPAPIVFYFERATTQTESKQP